MTAQWQRNFHEVDLLIGGTEKHEVRDPEVESHGVAVGVCDWGPVTPRASLPPEG